MFAKAFVSADVLKSSSVLFWATTASRQEAVLGEFKPLVNAYCGGEEDISHINVSFCQRVI